MSYGTFTFNAGSVFSDSPSAYAQALGLSVTERFYAPVLIDGYAVLRVQTALWIKRLEFRGGTIEGDATLTITDRFVWVAGFMYGSGFTQTPAASKTYLLGGGDRVVIDRYLYIWGQQSFDGDGRLRILPSIETFTNSAAAQAALTPEGVNELADLTLFEGFGDPFEAARYTYALLHGTVDEINEARPLSRPRVTSVIDGRGVSNSFDGSIHCSRNESGLPTPAPPCIPARTSPPLPGSSRLPLAR